MWESRGAFIDCVYAEATQNDAFCPLDKPRRLFDASSSVREIIQTIENIEIIENIENIDTIETIENIDFVDRFGDEQRERKRSRAKGRAVPRAGGVVRWDQPKYRPPGAKNERMIL